MRTAADERWRVTSEELARAQPEAGCSDGDLPGGGLSIVDVKLRELAQDDTFFFWHVSTILARKVDQRRMKRSRSTMLNRDGRSEHVKFKIHLPTERHAHPVQSFDRSYEDSAIVVS